MLTLASLLLAALSGTHTPTPVPLASDAKRLVDRVVAAKTQDDEQAAFNALVRLGCPGVPAGAAYLSDERDLPFHAIGLVNEAPDAVEGLRHYGPETVGDAVAAILNQVTGQHFGFVYNGATPKERAECVRQWRAYIASTPRSQLCGPPAPTPGP